MTGARKDIQQVAGIVTRLGRLRNSEYGNPRWRVVLNRECGWITKRNAAVAHGIDVHLLDKPVLLILENNMIIDIKELRVNG